MRAFVAIPVPEETRSLIERLAQDLRQRWPGARFVPTEQLHITLHFFAVLSPEQVQGVRQATREAVSKANAFYVDFGVLGVFPEERRPRVVWLGIREGAKECARLHDLLATALRARNLPCEDRPFRAHLTLARFREPPHSVQKVLQLHANTHVQGFMVKRLVLYESVLKSSGAIHTPIEEFEISARKY